jgi:transcription elongation GreA/GreB family factor
MDLAAGAPWQSQSGTDSQLAAGDRVVIRYLDDPKSKPLCYILTNLSDDRINGYLSLSSALGRALCEASPGDEILVDDGKGHRPILYMTLEHEIREVA